MITGEQEEMLASLGEELRAARKSTGLDISTVAQKTKISEKNIKALEDSDFRALPAEVFTRGFYKIYASFLSLDPTEVLRRYDAEKANLPKDSVPGDPVYRKRNENIGEMAAPPTFILSSAIGFVLFIFLLFGAFLCWYFSWNPATFFSQKLRSLETQPVIMEQATVEDEISAVLSRIQEITTTTSAQAAKPKNK